MVKLLLSLVCAIALAVLMLQLRQQQLELQYQTNQLHNQIEKQQAKVWNQQLQIAAFTAPSAIARTASDPELHLVPSIPPPPPGNGPDSVNSDAE